MAVKLVQIGLRLEPREARLLRRVAKANARSASAEAKLAVLLYLAEVQREQKRAA